MLGIEENPVTIQAGDLIASRHTKKFNDETGHTDIIVRKEHTHRVKDSRFCPTQPEMWHLDGVCYDTRFTTVVRAVG
jgi:hypothetical protein